MNPRIALTAGSLLVMAGVLPNRARAEDPAPATAAAANNPPVQLDPMIVNGSRPPVFTGNIAFYGWNISECTEGSYFHIRRMPLVDAIGFRHQYLEEHPAEKAIVVVVTEPPDNRVSQALAAYTKDGRLRLHSAALGDISPRALSAADIDRPKVIQDFVAAIRDRYLGHAVFDLKTADSNNVIGMAKGGRPVVRGVLIAKAEETGDYSKVLLPNGQPIYRGSSDDMLTSAFYWLNSTQKVGLIPVTRARVTLGVADAGTPGAVQAKPAIRDSIVFDWDQTHYLYNDVDGTLALPLPMNPVTGLPYLVIKNGDVLEAIYFAATFAKRYPEESVVILPPTDGAHGAVAFTLSGKLWLLSPYLGRFALPPRFRIEQVAELAKVHAALLQREMKKLPPGATDRPPGAVAQALAGDSGDEQIRRAYLAFKDAGVEVKFASNDQKLPGLRINYRGSEYTYFAPAD
jgi:hypothetical protein